MKNVVNYFYDLFPNDIYQKNKRFVFEVNKINYIFVPYYEDLKKIEKIRYILSKLDSYRFKYNQIVFNKMNDIVTYVNGIPYILIKNNIENNNKIILNDIIDFNKYTSGIINDKLDLHNLLYLWMDKVDYFEYQVSQFGIKFPIIRHSFNYFIGLAENAIGILNEIAKKEIVGTISHFRIYTDYNITDLYNPLNFIIDSRVRDICEYFKGKMFFYDISEEFSYYFNYNYFSNDEMILFLARFLFPTYYFDVCENIILSNDEEYLKLIVSKINIYENNIKFVYNFLKVRYQIPEISWLLV